MCELSFEIRRQIGVLLDRTGMVHYVLIGTTTDVTIPPLKRFQLVPGRLRGLRLVHTHISGEDLTSDDMNDLAMLRLDAVSVLHFDKRGLPARMQTAYLLPPSDSGAMHAFLDETDPYRQDIDFAWFIETVERDIINTTRVMHDVKQEATAVVVGVFASKTKAEEHIAELTELARSANVAIIKSFPQIRGEIHPKFVVGPGKLKDVVIHAMQYGADMIIFDNTLSPAQGRSVAQFTELKILDRTQLILDIFARRAISNEGKIRVELAQLKHILPRLTTRDDSLSRLTGGIGGRGPGETKLEIDKRRIGERIAFLTKKLKEIEKNRVVQRSRRNRTGLPVISIVGYTNAGKSTLLNSLTSSEVYADNLMFATLDTSSKRIRFPRERDVIVTDTVGFIRDLPADLAGAFKSTLEELGEADLLLHVVDAASPHREAHIKSVETILKELELDTKPIVLCFNKIDMITPATLESLEMDHPNAVFVSALDRKSFRTLLERLQYILFREGSETELGITEHYEPLPDDDDFTEDEIQEDEKE